MDIQIHDTSGDDWLSSQRRVVYKGADLFILCVSPDSKESFQNIEKWRKELQLAEPDVPIILFMNKSDLPDSSEMF